MTTIPLLPTNAAAVCPPSAGQSGQCRRCSFLGNANNLTAILMAQQNDQPQQQCSLPTGKQLTAALANTSKSIRRLSPPAMNTSPFVRLMPLFVEGCSGQHSRGESTLELEALTAVHQFAIAVQNIAVSEMLPRTPDLIFVNLTTLDGQPYCLELTAKGWRVTSLRTDCMQGDFTRMELFTQYYESLHELMDVISPGYRERFADDFRKRFDESDDRRHNYPHSTGCSSGPMSDCSEDGDDNFANLACTFCRKRLSIQEENGRRGTALEMPDSDETGYGA